MKKDILIWKDGKTHLNPELAFEFSSVHGVPIENFEDMVNKVLPPKSAKRAYFVALAYDKAHGTNYAERLGACLTDQEKRGL